MEYPRPEQVELCTPVHLALDQLQPIHLSFELTVTPFMAQSILHRLKVLAQPAGEADELLQLTSLGRAQPLVKFRHRARVHHPSVRSGQLLRPLDLWE